MHNRSYKVRKSLALSWKKVTAVVLSTLPCWLLLTPAARAFINVNWSTSNRSAPSYRLLMPYNTCQRWQAPSGSASYFRIGQGTLETFQGAETQSKHPVDVTNDGTRLVITALPSPAKWVFSVTWDKMFEQVANSSSVALARNGTMTYFVPNQQGKMEAKQNWPVRISFTCNATELRQ